MTQKNPQHIRPFMSMDIFDRVSAVTWGHNALDYHTNYIIPRAYWNDSDIREEALYYAGLAHGLRLGAAQKPNQPEMHQGSCQDKQSTLAHKDDDEIACSNSSQSTLGKHDDSGVAFRPQVSPKSTPNHHPSVPLPFENDPVTTLRPTIIEHGPEASHGSRGQQDAYKSTWEYVDPETVLRPTITEHAPEASHGPRHQQDAYNSTWEYVSPETVRHSRQMNPMSEESILRAIRSRFASEGFASEEQRANLNKAKAEHQETANPFAKPSAPDPTTPSIPLTDSMTPQYPVQMLADHPLSQPPVAASKAKNILAPLFDHHHENNSDEDLCNVSTSSTWGGSSSEGGFDEAMEQWLEEHEVME